MCGGVKLASVYIDLFTFCVASVTFCLCVSFFSDPYVKVTLKRKNKPLFLEQTKKKKKVSTWE